MKGVSKRRSARKTSYKRKSPKNSLSKRRSVRKSARKSARKSPRKSVKRSARKSARKIARKSTRKSARKSTRKMGKKCSCCNYVKCRCPRNCKCRNMKGGSSCNMKGGSSCNMKGGSSCHESHRGGAKKSMDVEVRPRSTRRSATKANIALSAPRKQREKRAEKIKLTKEFKKELDVEIDRLAELMGTNNKYAISDTINQVAELGMLMGNMGFTPAPRQQQKSSALPPARFTFTRQPSKTEYTAEDVMARFRN